MPDTRPDTKLEIVAPGATAPTQPVEISEYELSLAERQLCSELHGAIASLNSQLNGALTLILRQHSLVGEWNLTPDATKLVKGQTQPPAKG